MENIPLKSIKFPDLADTYTVPSNAGELPYNKNATYPADTVGKALQNIGDSSAPAIIETATGSIASFDDGADNIPVKDLIAEIVPIQSGSGDPSPSNVRAISGWSECNVSVAGKNLFNPNIESKTVSGVTYSYSDGGILLNGTKSGESKTNLTSVVMDFPAGTYTFFGSLASGTIKKDNVNYGNISAYLIDEGGNATSLGQLFESKTITLSESIRAYLRLTTWSDNVVFTNALLHLQIETGSQATTYEPYNGETHTISFASAGTVYGGRLDVTSGVLVVDRAMTEITASSDLALGRSGSSTSLIVFALPKNSQPHADTTAPNIVANRLPTTTSQLAWGNESVGVTTSANGVNCWLRLPSVTTVLEATAYLANNPIQICYELTTPTTVQLTPTEVKTLLKNNNIWADTGDVTVEYVADTKTFIENLVNA